MMNFYNLKVGEVIRRKQRKQSGFQTRIIKFSDFFHMGTFIDNTHMKF